MTVTSTTQTSQVYATNNVTATKATSAYDTASSSQPVDKMDEMKEKYKDIYTPIPETYSKADEDLQIRKIHEAYPNYISGPDFLKIVDSFYDGEPIELGTIPTQEQKNKQEIAFEKAYELFGGKEAFTKMQKDVFIIKDNYPVNHWGKDERTHNATELARFENAAIYEGLEQGKTLKEAKIQSASMRFSFMDITHDKRNFIDTLIKAGRIDPNATPANDDEYKVNFDSPNNSTMDLRKYGIEGEWSGYTKYENQNAMISEIEKKISQFTFMLNNEDLMKEAYMKLDSNYHDLGNNAGYKNMINNELMPAMNFTLNLFENYKIYDSVDIKV